MPLLSAWYDIISGKKKIAFCSNWLKLKKVYFRVIYLHVPKLQYCDSTFINKNIKSLVILQNWSFSLLLANVSAILMAWNCSELLEKCYCIAQCQMSVDKYLTWGMGVSSLFKRKNICKTFSKPFTLISFKTQFAITKWFTKPCIFALI